MPAPIDALANLVPHGIVTVDLSRKSLGLIAYFRGLKDFKKGQGRWLVLKYKNIVTGEGRRKQGERSDCKLVRSRTTKSHL
jgi:hypothetical protein